MTILLMGRERREVNFSKESDHLERRYKGGKEGRREVKGVGGGRVNVC